MIRMAFIFYSVRIHICVRTHPFSRWLLHWSLVSCPRMLCSSLLSLYLVFMIRWFSMLPLPSIALTLEVFYVLHLKNVWGHSSDSFVFLHIIWCKLLTTQNSFINRAHRILAFCYHVLSPDVHTLCNPEVFYLLEQVVTCGHRLFWPTTSSKTSIDLHECALVQPPIISSTCRDLPAWSALFLFYLTDLICCLWTYSATGPNHLKPQ